MDIGGTRAGVQSTDTFLARICAREASSSCTSGNLQRSEILHPLQLQVTSGHAASAAISVAREAHAHDDRRIPELCPPRWPATR